MNPFEVVGDFEEAVALYTGAPFCVAVNSCTNALFLSLKWCRLRNGYQEVNVPKRTYVSVPMQVIHAGYGLRFVSKKWSGAYQLNPTPVWDCARRFTSGMYKTPYFMCTSHHWSKPLGIQQGGCILHHDPVADKWFRKARFDGRSEGVAPHDDDVDMLGWHCYMAPEIAAAGLVRLSHLRQNVADLPNDAYPDLSKLRVFQ